MVNLLDHIIQSMMLETSHANENRRFVKFEERSHPARTPHCVGIIYLLIRRECPEFENNRLLTLSLLNYYGRTTPLTGSVYQTAPLLLYTSCCFSSLWFQTPQVRVYANPETWKTHSLENMIRRKKLKLEYTLSIDD